METTNESTPVAGSKGTQHISHHSPAACELNKSVEAYVAVLYVGGTIGMKKNTQGAYEPVQGHLYQELKTLPMFNDPNYVVSLSPGAIAETSPPLATPLSNEGKRVVYSVFEFDPLLDSSNMGMDDYAIICKHIVENYHLFDGFVILHGTDTMAYTASALSFMLEDLGKPVVLTGSQVPIFEVLSDGRDNMLGALHVAGHYVIAEVTLYFDNKLFRGNRASKVDSSKYDAFDSPNMPPLLTMGTFNRVNWDIVLPGSGLRKMHGHLNMCKNVGILWIFPSITDSTIYQFLAEPMQGVVLVSYGAGNAPIVREELLKALKEATDRGVLIVNITQCRRGLVSSSYATGKALLDVGVLAGFDMTPEAALTKLAFVLAHDNWTAHEKRKKMCENLRGEFTIISENEEPKHNMLLIERLCRAMSLTSDSEIENLKGLLYPVLLCSASQQGDLQLVRQLHQGGAILAKADYDGRTPLHLAAGAGHMDVCRYLLANGAILHTRDKFGHTALIDAITNAQFDVIGLLCNGGAAIETSFTPGRMASELCHLASESEIHLLKAWLAAGADINAPDYDGRTPLHVAVSSNNSELVEFLVKNGARADLADFSGKTPLHYAEDNNELIILDMLSISVERHPPKFTPNEVSS